jgi:hypothetical protein
MCARNVSSDFTAHWDKYLWRFSRQNCTLLLTRNSSRRKLAGTFVFPAHCTFTSFHEVTWRLPREARGGVRGYFPSMMSCIIFAKRVINSVGAEIRLGGGGTRDSIIGVSFKFWRRFFPNLTTELQASACSQKNGFQSEKIHNKCQYFVRLGSALATGSAGALFTSLDYFDSFML